MQEIKKAKLDIKVKKNKEKNMEKELYTIQLDFYMRDNLEIILDMALGNNYI